MANIVHVVGTGTIGEPIIGLLSKNRQALGIDEVTFYKHSPRETDRPMIRALLGTGARLAVAEGKKAGFEELGLSPDFTQEEALERATVVIDCTPSDAGLANKERHYEKLNDGNRVFMAQGSEDGFGRKYAIGINDAQVDPAEHKFIHVVSCNTHNISVLLKALGFNGDTNNLTEGRFVCIRRAGDVSDTKFIQAPKVDKHKDPLGTHHATDVADLYKTTLNEEVNVFSSALKIPTPYMHTIHFHLKLNEPLSAEEAERRLRDNKLIGTTKKMNTNEVFSFAREHGAYGRVLSQTVINLPSLHVSDDGKEVTGFAFTPQDGNALLSSIAATVRTFHPEDWEKRVESTFGQYLFSEY